MLLTMARNGEEVDVIVVHAVIEAMTAVPEVVQREYEIAVKVVHRMLLKVVPEVVQREYE